MKKPSLDNFETWKGACLLSALQGINDAVAKRRQKTGRDLIEFVIREFNFASLDWRRGHESALRRIYGGARKGIASTQLGLRLEREEKGGMS